VTDYHVVYVAAEKDEGAVTAGRLQRECNVSAREGWQLVFALADAGTRGTRGIWLFFTGEDAKTPAVAVAEEIVAEQLPQ
jgi:hypothetical protein